MELFGFKTTNVDNCLYVTEVWCIVCAAQQNHFVKHPNLKRQVLDSSIKKMHRWNNVKKSALDRHMDTSAVHNIAMKHHKPSTSQCHQELFIQIFSKVILYPEVMCFLIYWTVKTKQNIFSSAISPDKKDEYIREQVYSLALKVVSATFLLVCFLSLKQNTCKTRKSIFYFISKALFILEKINF